MTEEVKDILKTWQDFLSQINQSRDYREYHCLTNYSMETIEDSNIARFKAVLQQKLMKLGASPSLLDHPYDDE